MTFYGGWYAGEETSLDGVIDCFFFDRQREPLD